MVLLCGPRRSLGVPVWWRPRGVQEERLLQGSKGEQLP